jgi:hypothetical protein
MKQYIIYTLISFGVSIITTLGILHLLKVMSLNFIIDNAEYLLM